MLELDEHIFLDNYIVSKWLSEELGAEKMLLDGAGDDEGKKIDLCDATGVILDMQRRVDGMYCLVQFDNIKLPATWFRESLLSRV